MTQAPLAPSEPKPQPKVIVESGPFEVIHPTRNAIFSDFGPISARDPQPALDDTPIVLVQRNRRALPMPVPPPDLEPNPDLEPTAPMFFMPFELA